MAVPTKTVRVTLRNLRCNSVGDDPGSHIEVYGRLSVRDVMFPPGSGPTTRLETVLWDFPSTQLWEFAAGEVMDWGHHTEFVIPVGDELWLGGRMREQDDFGPDDTLGDGYRRIPFDAIRSEPISVGFNESGQEVVAFFEVEVIAG
jgi:hypothetical protein